MDDQKIRMEMEWLGKEGAEQLRGEIAQLKGELQSLVVAFTSGQINETEFNKAHKDLAGALKTTETALKIANQAAQALAAGGEAEAARAAQALADKEAQAAQALADAARKTREAAEAAEMLARKEFEAGIAAKKLASDQETFAAAAAATAGAASNATGGTNRMRMSASELGAESRRLKAALQELAARLLSGSISQETYDAGAKRLADRMGLVNAAAGRSAGGISNLQQRFTAAGYAFQDFTATSGDFGQKLNSISNNIPNLLAGLGGIATGISVAVTAGIALYRNWDAISVLWQNRTAIDGLLGSLKGLEEAVKNNESALDKLRSAGSLNNTQMAEYNKLTAESIDLEKKLTEARDVEAAKKAHGRLSSEADRNRATGVTKAVDESGGFENVVANMVNDYLRRFGIDDAESKANITKQTEQQLAKAMKGDAGALKSIENEGKGKKGGPMAGLLASLANKFNPDTIKKKEYDDKRVDELNKEGEKNQKEGEADQKRKDEAARKEAVRIQELRKKWLGEAAEVNKKEQAEKDREAKQKAKKVGRITQKEGKERDKETEEWIDDQQKMIEGTSADEHAAATASQMRAEGGARDKFGRFQPMDFRQQRDFLTDQLRAYLKKTNPRLGFLGTERVAGSMSEKAFKETDEGIDQRKTQAMTNGMDEMSATQAALIATNQAMLARLAALEQDTRRNGREARKQVPQSRTVAPVLWGS